MEDEINQKIDHNVAGIGSLEEDGLPFSQNWEEMSWDSDPQLGDSQYQDSDEYEEAGELTNEDDDYDVWDEDFVIPFEEWNNQERLAYDPEFQQTLLKRKLSEEIRHEMPFYNEDIEEWQIVCYICLEKKIDFEILECKHKFCKSCMTLLIVNYINTGKIFADEMKCPSCSTQLSEIIINKYTTKEQTHKILMMRIQMKGQKLVSENKAIHCPIPDCNGFGYIFQDDTISACSECHAGICVLCKKGAHSGMSCKEYEELNPEAKLDELVMSRNWKRCPSCGAACIREDGCNFVVCDSPVCRGNQSFCNLCGKPLVEEQHFSHFLKAGPFGSTCNTLDGTPEPPF